MYIVGNFGNFNALTICTDYTTHFIFSHSVDLVVAGVADAVIRQQLTIDDMSSYNIRSNQMAKLRYLPIRFRFTVKKEMKAKTETERWKKREMCLYSIYKYINGICKIEKLSNTFVTQSSIMEIWKQFPVCLL